MHTAALVHVRPIDSRDRDAFSAWFGRLSDESRRRRFLGPKPRLSARELTFLTEVDHVSHTALVAVDDAGRLIGEARYAVEEPGTADFAVTVADEWQSRGVGTRLARRLIGAARANGMNRLTALTLAENAPARKLLERLGFRPVGYDGEALEYALVL
jgi:RimJ/RimL family protein N-acetyltransferase